MSVASELIERQRAGRPATGIDASKFQAFLKQLRQKVVEPSRSDPIINRDIGRGLARIGLQDMDGNPLPNARVLVSLLLRRLIDDQREGRMCEKTVSAQQLITDMPSVTREDVAQFNAWLVQSTVRPNQRIGSTRQPGLNERALSHTPFTIEFVRKCHVPLGQGNG